MKRKEHIFDCIGIFLLVEMYVVYQLDVSSTIKIMAGIFSAIMIGICFVIGSSCDLKRMEEKNIFKRKKKQRDKKTTSNLGSQRS